MGMFDYVNFKMSCPTCGSEVSGFQSKDGPCYLEIIEPDTVGYFYADCHSCKSWITVSRDYQRLPPREEILTLDQLKSIGFEVHVREKELAVRPGAR